MVAYVHAPESTGFVQMRARSPQQFSASPDQSIPAIATGRPPADRAYRLDGSANPRSCRTGLQRIVEPVLAQQLIEAPTKGATRGRRQVRSRDPHRRLPRAFAFAHRHATHCSTLRLTSGYSVGPWWMGSSAGRTVLVDCD